MNKTADIISESGVAVVLTDTIYGIVAKALNQKTVERVYKIKKRAPEKPFIILISNVNQLSNFGVELSESQEKIIGKLWPGPFSIILKAGKDLDYLKRGGETLAFRLPNSDRLKNLVDKTGPLIAPSANPEDLEPASSIEIVRDYFGNEIDVFEDGGEPNNNPSTLIDLSNDKAVILRGDESVLDDII